MSRRSHVGDPPSKIEIPITPILDLSFQLLFFFVVTYNPVKKVEGDIDMSLPTEKKEDAGAPQENPPPSEKIEPKVEPKMTIIVRSSTTEKARGVINQMLTEMEGEPSRPLPLQRGKNNRLDLKELKTRLLRLKLQRDADAPSIVKLKADADVRVKDLIQIMDACKDKDFENREVSDPKENPAAKGLNYNVSWIQPQKLDDRRNR